jgi:hypothetical protein
MKATCRLGPTSASTYICTVRRGRPCSSRFQAATI